MAKLLHEIWIEDTSFGPVPSLVLAGPDGDLFRQGLVAGARLVRTFEAENNYEALTAYYAHNGWGEYRLNLPEDKRSYPDDWRVRQGLTEPGPVAEAPREPGQDTDGTGSTSDTPQLRTDHQ